MIRRRRQLTPRVALVAAPAASMRPHLICSLPSHSSRSSDISESRSQRAAKGPLERAGLAGLAAAAVLAAALLLLLLLCSASLRRLWAGGSPSRRRGVRRRTATCSTGIGCGPRVLHTRRPAPRRRRARGSGS
ncbi:hypothetical protein PVAP13_9NG362214 [Panicum virgatum]|uniref:Uncharacterized protein n=1 Tax=Panicum virgatum TaxID=38727 RepID=A0A8T0MWJ5_PANVG|nr:hypothetical protein PVAP13_9NG362214 [Panicum virgatum]